MKGILMLIYAVIGSLGMVLIRLGGSKSSSLFNQSNINMSINITLLVGFLFYIASFLLCLIILQKLNLVYFSAISYGITFIITSILSYILLGEVVSGIQYLGVGLIIMGVVIISFSKKNNI